MKRRVKRAIAGVALAGAVAALAGCDETVHLFTVDLQLRLASSLGDDLGAFDFNAGYLTDTGVDNGAEPGEVAFPADAEAATFTVLALGDGVTGQGRSAELDVPGDNGTLEVPLFVAARDDVAAANVLPPDVGAGSCVASDEAGRVFVVGGDASGQSGYVFDTDAFDVIGLADLDSATGVSGVGCSANAGFVVFAGGCAGGVIDHLVETAAKGVNSVELNPPAVCGSFAARANNDGYWIAGPGGVQFYSASGTLRNSREVAVDVLDVEVTADGDLVVLTAISDVLLFKQGSLNNPVTLGAARALGRRFDDVALLNGSSVRVVKRDGTLQGLGADVDADVTAFTVLSNDTVVGVDGTTLRVSRDDGSTQTFTMATARTHVSAIVGDTLLLVGGGAGVDAITLSEP